MKYYVSVVLLTLVTYELFCAESTLNHTSYSVSGKLPRGFVNAISLSGHFSLSANNIIPNDYMNSSSVPITYNYGFEIGFLRDRTFNEYVHKKETSIWQYGIMFGTTNFRSTMEEENPHTVFRDDPQQASYKTVRSFTHNTGFLTLRPTASIQFSFLPQKLLLVSGIKVGYRFSEFYEDNLTGNDRKMNEYLPWHSLQYRKNDVKYVVYKSNNTQDYLYGLQLGVVYQLWKSHEDNFYKRMSSHTDLCLGVEYIRANLLGNGVEDYMFYGINLRHNL